MMNAIKKKKCIMKDCNEVRYKEKSFCEKHLKEIRAEKIYKRKHILYNGV